MKNFFSSLFLRGNGQKKTATVKGLKEIAPVGGAKQYDVFVLAKDLNPVTVKGIEGVILEVWDEGSFEVEFPDKDGFNFKFEDASHFTIDSTFVGDIIWRS